MSHEYDALVSQFRESLTQQRYNRVVVHSYCRNADYFLSHLAARKIALEAVTPTEVSNYLRLAVRQFRRRHGRAPARYWVSIPRSGIHGLLRLALKRWPVPDMATGGARAGSRIDRCLDVGGSIFLRLVHRAIRHPQLHGSGHSGRRFLLRNEGARTEAEISKRCGGAAPLADAPSS